MNCNEKMEALLYKYTYRLDLRCMCKNVNRCDPLVANCLSILSLIELSIDELCRSACAKSKHLHFTCSRQ